MHDWHANVLLVEYQGVQGESDAIHSHKFPSGLHRFTIKSGTILGSNTSRCVLADGYRYADSVVNVIFLMLISIEGPRWWQGVLH